MAAIFDTVTNYCQGLSIRRMEIQLDYCDHIEKVLHRRSELIISELMRVIDGRTVTGY